MCLNVVLYERRPLSSLLFRCVPSSSVSLWSIHTSIFGCLLARANFRVDVCAENIMNAGMQKKDQHEGLCYTIFVSFLLSLTLSRYRRYLMCRSDYHLRCLHSCDFLRVGISCVFKRIQRRNKSRMEERRREIEFTCKHWSFFKIAVFNSSATRIRNACRLKAINVAHGTGFC